mmetsp:Transcript_47365/g.110804  ORF Transcript_47365/g.110804 Transcript_47365/m.110804 type:complete len:144 (-) Transcript_47365:78-509(-)
MAMPWLPRAWHRLGSSTSRWQAPLFRRSVGCVATAEELRQLSPLKAAPVFVFFTASWCQPCRAFAPHLEEISTKFEGPHLKMVQVDVTALPEAAREFRVDAVPYFVILRDGHVVERVAGNEPKAINQLAERHALAFEKLQKDQ